MYLHKDREMFKDVVEQTAEQSGRTPIVVEKDYYVTLILKLLAEQLDLCVFKGGTSLSKGYHVINRFSEDIDITFKEHIGESRRKKLKNVVLRLQTGMKPRATGTITLISFHILLYLNWKMKDCRSI